MFSKFTFSIIVNLFGLFHYLKVASAGETYQTVYNKCLEGQGACIVLNFAKGYQKAELAPLHLNDLGECADDSVNHICLFKRGGGAQISCGDSTDGIEADSNGKVITVIYYGNSKQNFATNGDGTSVFSVTCYVKL